MLWRRTVSEPPPHTHTHTIMHACWYLGFSRNSRVFIYELIKLGWWHIQYIQFIKAWRLLCFLSPRKKSHDSASGCMKQILCDINDPGLLTWGHECAVKRDLVLTSDVGCTGSIPCPREGVWGHEVRNIPTAPFLFRCPVADGETDCRGCQSTQHHFWREQWRFHIHSIWIGFSGVDDSSRMSSKVTFQV